MRTVVGELLSNALEQLRNTLERIFEHTWTTIVALFHQMRWPSTEGWISIVGVALNALGVFILFLFRLEVGAGYETRTSAFECGDRNRRRTPKRYVGFVLLWFGVALQAFAQFFP